jgi:hypothetical protein
MYLTIFSSFTSGGYISTYVAPVFAMGKVEDVGRRTGMLMSIAALGALCGPPISGAIIKSGGYQGAGFFAGKREFASYH